MLLVMTDDGVEDNDGDYDHDHVYDDDISEHDNCKNDDDDEELCRMLLATMILMADAFSGYRFF